MRTAIALTILASGILVASRASAAPTSLRLGAGGGLGALSVEVDVAHRSVRAQACSAEPCAVTDASAALAIDTGGLEIDPARVTVTEVSLAGGRRVAHVKVGLGPASEPEALAWEALLASGSPPLFAGLTGWRRGEPGERSGTDIRFLSSEGAATIVIGEIREDLRICGDEATLLDPRGLDPKTMIFHGATLQRLTPARRDAAISITATPRRGHADPALAALLTATDASSALPRAPASALTDGDPATSWSEARPGRGQGEFVAIRAPFDVPIVRFAVTVTPTARRPEGAAPETFYLATSTATYEVTLPEDAWAHPGAAYDVVLPQPIKTSCVSFVLADAYTRGRAHPDVTVAELVAYSAFDHPGATLADVASALRGGDASALAAAGLLERAGPPGVAATTAAYGTLDAAGRALAMNVASSASSCEVAAPLFTAALGDADEVVHAKALGKLEQPTCGRQALPALIAGLKSTALRARVAPLVAFLERERGLTALAGELGEGPESDRRAIRSAVAFSARAATPDALALVLAASRRSAAAQLDALRSLHDRIVDVASAADASMRELLAHSSEVPTRYLLVDVLAPLAAAGDAAAQGLLRDLIVHDASPEVRAHATENLGSVGQSGDVVASALHDPAPRVREAALNAIAAAHALVPTPTTQPIAHLLADDPWTFVRVASAAALGGLPASPPADGALADALDQLSPRVREQAVLALAAHRARGYRDALHGHLMDAKEDTSVRLASARAAGLLCDTSAVTDLARFVVTGASSPDPREVALGLVATDALGAIHPAEIASLFLPLQAKTARPDARAAAARALAGPRQCPLP